MKKTERRTPNAVYRMASGDEDRRLRIKEYNAQRPTLNAQRSISRKPRFDLEDRLRSSVRELSDWLMQCRTRAANHLAGQLLRSGTSPYGNHGEVEAAESRKDFVHKLQSLSQGAEGDSVVGSDLASKSSMLPSP